MKNQKAILKVAKAVLFSAILFLYFLVLSDWGRDYRENRKNNNPEEKTSIVLNTGWKFRIGDSLNWASPNYNDSSWVTVSSDYLPSYYDGQPAWFRLHLKTDSILLSKPLMLSVEQYGASEIYFNGFLLASFGKPASKIEEEETMNPDLPINIQLNEKDSHLIAVRYSNLHFNKYQKWFGNNRLFNGFKLSLQNEQSAMQHVFSARASIIAVCSIGIFLLTLSFVHFLLYLFYRKAKENLFYSLFAFFYALMFFVILLLQPGVTTKPQFQLSAIMSIEILFPLLVFSLLLFVRSAFQSHFPKWLWGIAIACGMVPIIDIFLYEINPSTVFGSIMWLCIFSVITIVVGTYKAIRKKIPGAKILGAGMSVFALFIFIILSIAIFNQAIIISNSWLTVMAIFALLSIPLSMSIYLAYNFSTTNQNLLRKLVEVEELSAKTIAQEKEKQEILSKQKELLEIQVAERTKEIIEQKKIIENKNKDITDSINYAKRIQDAILPSEEQIKKMLPESFV
jgi:hypothetical protein